MTDLDLAPGLGAWAQGTDALDPVLWRRVAAHPRLTEAAQALARNMLAAGAADKSLDAIFKDAGRYGVTFIAVYLHLSGGLTLPRLKKVAVQLASPGRARTVLLYLRYLGYITRGTRQPGDPECWVPTPKCLSAWARHLQAALRAAAVIESGCEPVVAALDQPEIFATFARHHSESLIAAMAKEPEHLELPFFRIFMHRHAGNQVFWTLLLAEAEGRFPPRRTLPVAPGDIARRFGVSRTHVHRMLEAAARETLLTREPGDVLAFNQDIAPFLTQLYASQLVWLLSAAARTLEAHPHLNVRQ